MSHYIMYTDGAARGNPGQAGCGISICDSSGEEVEFLSQYLGHATNNEAEYHALIIGLDELQKFNPNSVEIRSDSELMVRQINGEYKVKNPKLRLLYEDVMGFLKRFNDYQICHIRREDNSRADELANYAIDNSEDA